MMSENYQRFYDLCMKNMVTVETLNELAAAGKLTQYEIDRMVADRKEKYGY